MQNKLKPVISIIAICLFMLFALSSDRSLLIDFLDEFYSGTNTSVPVYDCEPRPPITGKVNVTIRTVSLDGSIRPFISGDMFLIHQNVIDTCKYEILANQVLSFNTGANGIFVYTGVDYVHDNSQDLYRIEIKTPGGTGRMQVGYYSNTNFYFELIILPTL